MAQTYTRPEFVKRYGGFIANAVKGTGLLVGTVVAQAILESQGKVNGTYRVGGSKLSREANNYFGIKCHGWSGKGYNIDTGEQKPDGTKYIQSNACFRAYDSVEDSILDYIKFLKSNPRYERAGVFKAKTVKEQAEALKRAGYATAVNYASTLDTIYKGVQDYVDKFNEYGVKGIAKSFFNNPIAFVKRNKVVVGLSVLMVASIGVGIYVYAKDK